MNLSDQILSRVSQEAIMQYYFPYRIEIGRKYINPYRKDSNPGCSFIYRGSVLYFVDFALSDNKAFNCYKMCMLKHNCSFKTALRIIDRDFNLGIYGPSSLRGGVSFNEVPPSLDVVVGENPKPAVIKVLTQEFKKEDLDFFSLGKITRETLNYFEVKSCKRSWINERLWHVWEPTDIQIRYKEGDKFKIYRPFAKNKDHKFRNDYDQSIIEGFTKLQRRTKQLFITKSKKDIMTLYEIGWDAVSVRSETTFLDGEQVSILKQMYDDIYVWFDNDTTGVEASISFTRRYDLKYINTPKESAKDPFDFVKENSQSLLNQLILNKIKNE